jgi:hypothetical protein
VRQLRRRFGNLVDGEVAERQLDLPTDDNYIAPF